ncbi:MAG TPA: C25 family cysteine peptidase, partial [Vicinamibacteria bacterium]
SGRVGRAANVVARFAVREPGLSEVRFEDIFGTRRRPIAIGTLRLSHQGRSVPFHVAPKASAFGRGSTLYFVSDGASENPYGPAAIYELEQGTSGTAMGTLYSPPSGTPVGLAWSHLAREENVYYQAGLTDSEELWFWDVLLAPERKSFPFELRGLAPTGPPAQLRLRLQGGSDFEAEIDHHAQVFLNGAWLGETFWDGKTSAQMTIEISPGLLREGRNDLEMENVGDTGVPYSMIFLDRYEVSYPRTLAAEGGSFEGAFDASGVVELDGFGGTAHVVDVSAEAPFWIEGTASLGDRVRFRVGDGRKYLVVGTEALHHPDVLRAKATALRSTKNRADYIVLGPRAFLSAVAPLADLRRSQGLRVALVSIEDVFDEFGFGESRPQAIREFLTHAYHRWSAPSPRYVLLVGDGSYDPKDYLGTGTPDPVPPLMVRTSYLWTASDPALASVNGEDALPDLALGRLPARNREEVEAMVEKILVYERSGQTLDGEIVLVADDADGAGNFEADMEALAETSLAGRSAERIYLSRLGIEPMRKRVLEAFDEGAALVSYSGHGGIHLWAQEDVLDISNVPDLAPQSRQPIVLALNCLNGYFHFPYFDSLAEALLKAPDRGAIAAFAPSGLSVNAPAQVLHRAIVREMLGGRHARLGDAVLAAQADYAAAGLMPELLRIYHLFGDPALRLR